MTEKPTPTPRARAIALYLPQYHPIPENNEWWGPGFTEWTNVAKARPLYRGHYQPHIPADLSFYDLRLAETRAAQAELAKAAGIEGFCYYHYWFAGRQIIERPFNEVLASGEPDFPFCLCWANQTWSGIWHGLTNRVLIEQTYPGREDHIKHFNALLPAFTDPRYIRVDGKPLFMIFSPTDLPEPVKTTALWRELAIKAGLPGLYITASIGDPDWNPHLHGFDASVITRLPQKRRAWVPWSSPYKKIRDKLLDIVGRPTIHAYRKVIESMITRPEREITSYPCVIPNWDNSPRSGSKGMVLHGSTPELFQELFEKAIARIENERPEHRIVFIKSWNEWAEGNHLEPDRRDGKKYLEATRNVLLG